MTAGEQAKSLLAATLLNIVSSPGSAVLLDRLGPSREAACAKLTSLEGESMMSAR